MLCFDKKKDFIFPHISSIMMCVVFPQSAAFRQIKEDTVKPSGTLRVQPKLHSSAIKLTQEANFAEKSNINKVQVDCTHFQPPC